MPGRYTVKLLSGGQTYSQPLTVAMDPRIKTSVSGLQQQLSALRSLSDSMRQTYTALAEARGAGQDAHVAGELKQSLQMFDHAFAELNRNATHVYSVIEGSDNAPTIQATDAVTNLKKETQDKLAGWAKLKREQLSNIDIRPLTDSEMERSQSSDKDQDEP